MVKKTESVVHLCLKLGCGYSMCASRAVRNLMNCHQRGIVLVPAEVMSLCRIVLFTRGRTVSIMGPLDYQTVVQAVVMRGGNNYVKNVKKK